MSTKLYVGNLAFHTTEDTLSGAFGQDSRKVNSIAIIADGATGRSRGFAFVEMANEADAQAAMKALDGAELDGRTLRVNEAHERQSSSNSRGPSREQQNW